MPRASIIVAFHNARDYLRSCVDSLARLNHPEDDYEIVLVDDGSTDNSMETVKDLIENLAVKVKVVREKDRGPAVARNSGIREATGEIILFTDPDCIVKQDWLLKHSRHYADAAVGGVEGRVETDWEKLLVPRVKAPVNFRYVTANMSYRRDALEEVGLFDERFWYKEDDELAYRVLEKRWKIPQDREAIVYHQPKKMSLKSLFSWGLKHEFDVLFYKKHPEIAMQLLRGTRFGSIVLTPLSACLATAGLVLAITLVFLWIAPIISFATLMGCLVALVALDSRLKKEVPRKSALWMAIYAVFMGIGRLRGSFKYRVLLL